MKMIMAHGNNGDIETGTVSYIEIDIDYPFCLVRHALTAPPEVVALAEDAAVACLAVTHRTQPGRLLEVVIRVGHRLDVADRGEVSIGSVIAADIDSCAHHQAPIRRLSSYGTTLTFKIILAFVNLGQAMAHGTVAMRSSSSVVRIVGVAGTAVSVLVVLLAVTPVV